MNDETARDLHLIGVYDQVCTHFSAKGPYRDWAQCHMSLIYTDFSGGPEINITNLSAISDLEIQRNKNSDGIYYKRGRESGEQIMHMLIEAAEFQQRVKPWWWFRLGLWPGRVIRSGKARLSRFVRFVLDKGKTVVYAVLCRGRFSTTGDDHE